MIKPAGRRGRRKMSQKLTRASQGTGNETCDVVWTGGKAREEMMI